MPRLTEHALSPEVLLQLFFQHPTRLNEEASIDGFERHVQGLIIPRRPFEPAGDQRWRPIECELATHYIPKLPIKCESTQFGATRTVPGAFICPGGLITLRRRVPRNLPADGRRLTLERLCNLTQ